MPSFITLVLALAGSPACAQPADLKPLTANLAPNGGFETQNAQTHFAQGWSGFSTSDWGACAGQAVLSTAKPHGGGRCVEVSGVKVRYAVGTDRLPIEPGKTYLLRGWIRADLRTGEEAYVAASWFSETRWLSLQSTKSVRGAKPWTQVQVLLPPAARSEQAKEVQISCRVESQSAVGRAWFDDVELFEVEPPPPEPLMQAEQRRYRNLARELLIRQALWQARTEVLRRRRADLGQLLPEQALPFTELVKHHAEAVRVRSFLFEPAPSFAEVEAQVVAQGGDIEARLDELHATPDPRDAAFAEREALLTLKRRLAASPDLRRFYLWAQLEALRPRPQDLSAPAVVDAPDALRPERVSGEAIAIVDPVVRPALDLNSDRGTVRIETELLTDSPDARLAAALWDAAGRPVAFACAAEAPQPDGTTSLELEVPSPRYWFPDCPYLYRLVLGVEHDGKYEAAVSERIAFCDIRCVETDVTAAMRHAWELPLVDYAFVINGQPFFPTGTLCGSVSSEFAREQADLFEELWLDFQRTYGFSPGVLEGETAREFEERGISFLGAFSPSYQSIRSYCTADQGLEAYRENLVSARGVLSAPSLLVAQTGNEAELSVWGANLGAYYGSDLWHCFDEVARCVREDLAPPAPVMYVRAGHFNTVAPVPRDDLSGVNQYTGRYGGRVCTAAPDLAALATVAAWEEKPFGITEWNGPKYSWASSGVGGVTEEGAADYIYRYYNAMLRTPLVALSSEFTLNWVVTPIEDLTTVPIAEGLGNRKRFTWSQQQGCDWYPHIWPGALTDTPSRRAMRGFQSPLYFLRETPGEAVVAHLPSAAAEAKRLADALAETGKPTRAQEVGPAFDLAALDANVLLLGGLGDEQPACVRELERLRVIGRTDGTFPPAGRFLIQERVNPYRPDRYLVVATAADPTGMSAALQKLLSSAEGLKGSVAREASSRRVVALIDPDSETWTTFARVVLDLPTRGLFVGGDDLRQTLTAAEFLGPDGRRSEKHADLAGLVLAPSRALTAEERDVVTKLAADGVQIVVSLATYEADEALRDSLGVAVGPAHDLTESLPVEAWAQAPLAIPQIGGARAEAITTFGKVERGSNQWQQGATIREVGGEGWQPVARTDGGRPVVLRKGTWWVFGADIARVARLHRSVTSHGAIHSIYDRDTACGLERLSWLVANACAAGLAPRPVSTPQLRCTIETNAETLKPDDSLRVRVNVRDLLGHPVEGAYVGVGLAWDASGFSARSVPAEFVPAAAAGEGAYELTTSLPETPPAARYGGMRFLRVFADVRKPGCIPDATAKVVRVGDESDWRARVEDLAYLIRNRLVRCNYVVEDAQRFVEIDARVLAPVEMHVGREGRIEVTVKRVERDDGDDWIEDFTLVLRPLAGGADIVLPLQPPKVLACANAPAVKADPDGVTVVDSAHPATVAASWTPIAVGEYAVMLRYLYSDQYRIATTNRLPCEDRVGNLTLSVSP